MYDKNYSLDISKTKEFLSTYSSNQILNLIFSLCEPQINRAINNCLALGAERPSDLTPDEVREFEAYLTSDKRDEIVANLLHNIEEIRNILYLVGFIADEREDKNPKGDNE